MAYQVTTRRGQVLSGLIAAETAASITLKRGEGPRTRCCGRRSTRSSPPASPLMPDGLEMQISKQEMADLIAYLLKVGSGK